MDLKAYTDAKVAHWEFLRTFPNLLNHERANLQRLGTMTTIQIDERIEQYRQTLLSQAPEVPVDVTPIWRPRFGEKINWDTAKANHKAEFEGEGRILDVTREFVVLDCGKTAQLSLPIIAYLNHRELENVSELKIGDDFSYRCFVVEFERIEYNALSYDSNARVHNHWEDSRADLEYPLKKISIVGYILNPRPWNLWAWLSSLVK